MAKGAFRVRDVLFGSKSLIAVAWVGLVTALFLSQAAAQGKRAVQGQRYCYCANVSQGYQECDCGRYGFCDDCYERGSCPEGGGSGDIDFQDWWVPERDGVPFGAKGTRAQEDKTPCGFTLSFSRPAR